MESTKRNMVIVSPNHGGRRLQDGILRHLSEWNGLQMAVQNLWGGRDSHQKSLQLAADIFFWFAHSKAPLCVEDLENFLHDSLLLSFNTEIEDGSIEQVAEELMIMHEEWRHGFGMETIDHSEKISSSHFPAEVDVAFVHTVLNTVVATCMT